MRLTLLFSTLVLAVGFFGCGMLDDKGSKDGNALIKQESRGCVQGVVVNGITGERLSLRSSDGKEGVHVLVRNKLLRANTHVNGEKKDAFEGLKGEYYVCGIPLDTEFPLMAWKDGYQQFEGKVMIPSTIEQRTKTSQVEDIKLEFPTFLANIHLYPKGTQANDLLFTVVKYGEVVPGAQVYLKPTGANSLDPSRQLSPQIRSVPAIETTNQLGQVIFSGKDLVLGGIYEYTVIPPDGGEDISFKKGNIVVGLRQEGTSLTTVKPYEMVISVGDAATKLEVVARSTEAAEYNAEGKVVIWFNQPIEIAPGSSNSYSAILTNASRAELFAAGTSDSMKVDINGNRLTLTPVWKNGIVPNGQSDLDAVLTYRGLVLRPVGDSRSGNYLQLPSISTRIFDR